MEIVTALERPAEEQRTAFNLAFADYVAGRRILDLPAFGDTLVSHGVSLPGSYLALDGGNVAGFAYMCVYGPASRLAIMGVVPDRRGRGMARALLEHAIGESRRRGQEVFTLEVIEENEPAVRLYQAAGLRPRRRLCGYTHRGEAQPAATPRAPRPVPLEEAVGRLITGDTLRLPYQVSGHALARAPWGCEAHGLGAALLVIRPVDPERTLLMAMLDSRPEQGDLRDLLATLMARDTGKEWRIAQILPEELGRTVLEPLGFRPLPLTQLQMELRLTPEP